MEEIKKKQLPHDVVESILSHLPVKSLLRFKSVSKSWNSTISDQRFAGLHLRQSRKSSGNHDIFFWYDDSTCPYYYYAHKVIVSRKTESIETKIKFHLARKLDPLVLCYCDGLALRRYPRIKDKKYLLFNLFIGTYIEFTCPYPIKHDPHKTLYGVCYDKLTNQYKVVIISRNHYAVYYCRSNSWSEMKKVTKGELSTGRLIMGKGISLNGNLFWVLKTEQPPESESSLGKIEIVGFNSSDEKLIRFPRLKTMKRPGMFMYLTCLGGDLCLCINQNSHQKIKVGGEEESWREFEGALPLPEQAEEILKSTPEYENTVMMGYARTEMGYYRIPYLEHLFISEPKEKHVVFCNA